MERSGGVAAIVCDITGDTVRQVYCYTCLAIVGGISVGSLCFFLGPSQFYSHMTFSDVFGIFLWRLDMDVEKHKYCGVQK